LAKGALIVSNSIIGDKLSAQVDVKSSQAEKRDSTNLKNNDSESQTASASVPQDSIKLSVGSELETRPLSENVNTQAEAKASLADLLQNIQNSPEQAMIAQGQLQQSQVDALLSGANL